MDKTSIEDYRASNVDEVQVVELIEVKSLFGDGTSESVCRTITEYYTLEGILVCRLDPYATSNLDRVDRSKLRVKS